MMKFQFLKDGLMMFNENVSKSLARRLLSDSINISICLSTLRALVVIN